MSRDYNTSFHWSSLLLLLLLLLLFLLSLLCLVVFSFNNNSSNNNNNHDGFVTIRGGEDCTPNPPAHIQIPPVEIMEPWNYLDLVGTLPTCRPVSNFTDAELGLCKDYIEPFYSNDTGIYVDILTPARLQIVAAASAFITGTDPVCGVVGLRHVCPAMFPQCIPDVPVPGQGVNVTLRQYPCRELCEDVASACLDVFVQQLGLSQCKANASLQCYPVGTWSFYSNTTRDAFPQGVNGSTLVTIRNISSPLNPFDPALQWEYTTECFNATRFYTAGAIPVVCPSGFVASGSFCSYECPYPFIEDEEYTVLWAFAGALGLLSLVCCIFLLCEWAFVPRIPLSREVLYMTCCATGISFALFMGLLVGRDEMWCDDNHKPNLWGHPGCTIQGIILVYCVSAAVCWWVALLVMIALIMILRNIRPGKFPRLEDVRKLGQVRLCSLGKRRRRLQELKERFYAWIEKRKYKAPKTKEWVIHIRWVSILEHLLCWGVPAVQVLIALSAQKIGYSGSEAWCGIQSGEEVTFRLGGATGVERDGGDNPDWWNLFLFTSPLLILVLTGTLLGTLVMIYIVCSIPINLWRAEHERRISASEEARNKNIMLDDEDDEDPTWLGSGRILCTRAAWARILEHLLINGWRILVYPYVLILPFLFLFIFRVVFELQKPAAQNELADSLSCAYVKLAAPYVSNPENLGVIDDLCDSTPDDVISFPLWFVYVVLFASWPMVLLFLFGCRMGLCRCCWSLARRSVGKKGDLGEELIKKNSATGNSSSYYTKSQDSNEMTISHHVAASPRKRQRRRKEKRITVGESDTIGGNIDDDDDYSKEEGEEEEEEKDETEDITSSSSTPSTSSSMTSDDDDSRSDAVNRESKTVIDQVSTSDEEHGIWDHI